MRSTSDSTARVAGRGSTQAIVGPLARLWQKKSGRRYRQRPEMLRRLHAW